MHDPLQRLYRTKLALLATLLMFVGLGLMVFAHWAAGNPAWRWVRNWPILDVGTGLFTTGLLGVALQYFDGQDSEERATQRLERVLAKATPAMRDAVIAGFAFEPDDLARVATPETLDNIVTNGLALRAGDALFAGDIYEQQLKPAIAASERLTDVRILIRLSMDRGTAEGRAPVFVTTVRWEYELRPAFQTRRFVCLSDLDEFRELAQDQGATAAWYIRSQLGLDAGSRDSFELVSFTVDGEDRPIRRTSKQGSQTYTVTLGEDAMKATEPVSVAYTYRTVTSVNGHLLQLRVDQPTDGLSIDLDYTDCDIAYINVLDFMASDRPAQISKSPASVPEQIVSVKFDGWALPRSGVAFVWVTNSVDEADAAQP